MIAGDIHHIFPRAYLKKQGIDNRARYNQVAYYIYLDTQVNKAIGDQAPCEYFGKVIQQCEVKAPVLGNIVDMELLKKIWTKTVFLKQFIKWTLQIMRSFFLSADI